MRIRDYALVSLTRDGRRLVGRRLRGSLQIRSRDRPRPSGYSWSSDQQRQNAHDDDQPKHSNPEACRHIFNYPLVPAFAYRLLVPEAKFEGLPPIEVQVLCQSAF
jgi:hypothetical protein